MSSQKLMRKSESQDGRDICAHGSSYLLCYLVGTTVSNLSLHICTAGLIGPPFIGARVKWGPISCIFIILHGDWKQTKRPPAEACRDARYHARLSWIFHWYERVLLNEFSLSTPARPAPASRNRILLILWTPPRPALAVTTLWRVITILMSLCTDVF